MGLDVYGLDPSPEAIEYAAKNGVTVRQSGIKNLETFDGMTFDFLTLMNVLEHIAAPEEYLRQISDKVMDDSSILVIDVPNEFNALQICGQKVNELDEWWVAAPQHLNYFDLESLNCVLEAAGLELLHAQSSFPLEIFWQWAIIMLGTTPLVMIVTKNGFNSRRICAFMGLAQKLSANYTLRSPKSVWAVRLRFMRSVARDSLVEHK